MSVEAVFKRPFPEALDHFRDKVNIPTRRWDDLWKDQHARGFMIAGATKAELVADFRTAVDKAIADGVTLEDFRKDFDAIVAKHGWSYNGSRNWRSEVIYKTNIRTAYMAGRWAQLTDPEMTKLLPFLEYRHGDSIQPRAQHLAWDGLTLPADDPWWKTHYPPNGWGCKCKVFAAGPRDLARAGKTVPDQAPIIKLDPATGAPVGIGKGWDYNVGQAQAKGYRVLADKFETLPEGISRQWMQGFLNGPTFERFFAGKIEADFPVAVLSASDRQVLGSATQTVWLSAESLKKHLEKHPEIGIEDYRKIPRIIEKGEVWRRADRTDRLVYLELDGKLYRAALKRTKDGGENYFLTLFETSEELADRQVREFRNPGKEYERIR